VGFLVAGFFLNAVGIRGGAALDAITDVGITLLLFTIGLKLDASIFLRREVWATTAIHCAAMSVAFAALLVAIGSAGLPLLAGVDLGTALALGFALSFSSTVFAVKVFEKKGMACRASGRAPRRTRTFAWCAT
jgi:predicted Kef-type K+ transport protein